MSRSPSQTPLQSALSFAGQPSAGDDLVPQVAPTQNPFPAAPQATAPTDGSQSLPAPGPEIFPSAEDPNVYISNWTNIMENAANAATQSSVADLYRAGRNWINNSLTDSPVLNSSQSSALLKGRPGLTFPTNVRQATATALASDYDATQTRDNLLQHAQPTFLGGLSGMAGTAIGAMVTDPLAAAAATIAPEILPELIPSGEVGSGATAINETLGVERPAIQTALIQKTLTGFAKGALEGEAFTGTQQAAKRVEDATNGSTFDSFNASVNVGAGAFLGGPIHFLSSFMEGVPQAVKDALESRRAFSADASNDAMQAAANSVDQGKDPDMQTPLQNGFAQQVRSMHADLKAQNISGDEVISALDQAQQGIEDAQKVNSAGLIKARAAALADPENNLGTTEAVSNLEAEQLDLSQRSKAQVVLRSMANSSEDSLSKEQLDNYINNFNNPETDYANGRGQANLDEVGEPIKDGTTLLSDNFPEDYQKELLEKSILTSDEQDRLNNINNSDEVLRVTRKGIDNVINCLSGGGE